MEEEEEDAAEKDDFPFTKTDGQRRRRKILDVVVWQRLFMEEGRRIIYGQFCCFGLKRAKWVKRGQILSCCSRN